TRYELLAPGSGRFRILYEVTATAAGSTVYFIPIRKGSTATSEVVTDRRDGRVLPFDIVEGSVARAGGLPDADLETRYIRVQLPRPVPRGGEVRLLIDKTYEDHKSYAVEGQEVVFSRSLGIRRNAVVLPPGYELVGSNVAVQVATEADGRVRVSFMNATPADMPLVVRGRRRP
ncbi:MAG TPA: hypothetical protein VFM29_07790, partial [Vicinamibacteria bacterium]|nr:hypothetical protein [Vicinamibacteria bacterium]